MKNSKSLKLLCLTLILCVVFSCFFLIANKNKSVAEGVISSFEQNQELGQIEVSEIAYNKLTSKYVNRSKSYSQSKDGELPEYYTMMYGNGTATNKTKLSDAYEAYMIYVQSQESNGLCWAFAGTQVLTTSIMKTSGEYIDFSESWISTATASADSVDGYNADVEDYIKMFIDYAKTDYTPGSGGNFVLFDLVARNYGMVLEQDYDYAQSYLASQDSDTYNGNVAYLEEFYSQYASKTYLENYITVEFDKYISYSSETEQQQVINSMKKHILNNGAISLSTNWGSTNVYNYYSDYDDQIILKTPDTKVSGTSEGGHAVTIIGWDDTYNDGDGAWIVLNSWGNDSENGLLYVEYDDSDIQTSFYGYEYNPEIYKSQYAETDDDLDYTDIISYSNATSVLSETNLETAQDNIFYQNDSVEIEYTYQLSNGAKIDNFILYYQDEDITKSATITHDESSCTINIKYADMRLGSYKLEVYYSDEDQSKVHTNPFIITNGLELEAFVAYISESSSVKTGKTQTFNTYALGNKPITIATNVDSGKVYVKLYQATFSNIYKIEYEDYTGLNTYTYTSTQKFYVNYNLGEEEQVKYTLYLSDENNEFERTFDIIIFKVGSHQTLTWMEYNLDGGVNSELNLDKMALNVDSETEIGIPTKIGYKFLGWFYDSECSEKLTYKNSAYYIDYSKTVLTGNNKYASNFSEYYGDTNRSLCLYAKWEKISYVVSYNTNGGSSINSIIVDIGESIPRPSDPTKAGYSFIDWYKDEALTKVFDFSAEVMEELDITIYAKWQLSSATSVKISSNEWQAIGSYFTLNLAYEHALKGKSNLSYTIEWYKNNTLIDTNNSLSIEDKHEEVGSVSYYALITLNYLGEDSASVKSNVLTINFAEPVQEVLNLIYNSDGKFSWQDNSSTNATYYINLYKVGVIRDSLIASKTLDVVAKSDSFSVDFSENLSSIGKFYITFKKKVGGLYSNEVKSEIIEIVALSYVADTTEGEFPEKTYVDINSQVLSPVELTKTAYTFDGWYYDSEFTKSCEFPITITTSGETTVYAKWNLNPINCTSEGSLEGITYDKNYHTIKVIPSHELENASFEYEWYDENENLIEKSSDDTFSVKYVKDSGSYYCTVSLTDSEGRTTSTNHYFNVEILKASTEIDASELLNATFKYNTNKQYIDSGAEITRTKSDEPVELQYVVYSEENPDNTDNSFKDAGTYTVKITAPETENYNGETIEVNIFVNKARATLYVDNQNFIYIGEPVIPKGTISNEEQTLVFEGDEIIDVATYTRKVVAEETKNYERLEKEITIVVNPAKIHIKAKDITSIWLFGKQNLTYEITQGEIYGDDDLNVELFCDVDVNKPDKYKITLTAFNSNYEIALIEGTYTVTTIPYILGLIVLLVIVVLIIVKQMKKQYILDFEENGGSYVQPIETRSKKQISIATPVRPGFKFMGWFYDEALTIPFRNNLKKGKSVVLHAKWEKIENSIIENNSEDYVQALVNKIIPKKVEDKSQKIIQEQEIVQEVEQPKEKSQEDLMKELIEKASSENNSNVVKDEEYLKNLIDRISDK